MLNKTLKDSQAGSVIMSVIVLEDWEEQQMDLCILIKYHIFVMAWWKSQQYSSFGWFNAILSLWLVPIKPAISERIINFSWKSEPTVGSRLWLVHLMFSVRIQLKTREEFRCDWKDQNLFFFLKVICSPNWFVN